MLNSRLGADEGTQSLDARARTQLGDGYATAHSLTQHTLLRQCIHYSYMHYYHKRATEACRCSVLFIAPICYYPPVEPLSRLQVQGGENLQPGMQ